MDGPALNRGMSDSEIEKRMCELRNKWREAYQKREEDLSMWLECVSDKTVNELDAHDLQCIAQAKLDLEIAQDMIDSISTTRRYMLAIAFMDWMYQEHPAEWLTIRDWDGPNPNLRYLEDLSLLDYIL